MTEKFYTNIELVNKKMQSDISQEIKNYTVTKINELIDHTYDAMNTDKELEAANKDNFILQTLAEATCITIMNLFYSKILLTHWEAILQKMYFILLDEMKKCTKKQYNSETALAFINYRFHKFLQEMLEEFVNNEDESIQSTKQQLICDKENVIQEYIPIILETLINAKNMIKLLNF